MWGGESGKNKSKIEQEKMAGKKFVKRKTQRKKITHAEEESHFGIKPL